MRILINLSVVGLLSFAGCTDNRNVRIDPERIATERFDDAIAIACRRYKSEVAKQVLAATSVRIVSLSGQWKTFEELIDEESKTHRSTVSEGEIFEVTGWRRAYWIKSVWTLRAEEAKNILTEFVNAWTRHGFENDETLAPFGFNPEYGIEVRLSDSSSIRFLVGDGQICWDIPIIPGMYGDRCMLDTIPGRSSLGKRLDEIGVHAGDEPNKLPEPTTPSVTDRAGARSAPAGVVAHLNVSAKRSLVPQKS